MGINLILVLLICVTGVAYTRNTGNGDVSGVILAGLIMAFVIRVLLVLL